MFTLFSRWFLIVSLLSLTGSLSAQSPAFLWAEGAGGAGFDRVNDIAIVDGDHIIAAGFFEGTISIGDTTVTSAGGQNIWIARYTVDGILDWVRQTGGPDAEVMQSMAVDDAGHIILTGYFFGPSTDLGDTTLFNAGATDIFVAKFSPDGDFLWATRAGGATDDGVNKVSTDGQGNIVITGSFSDTADFGDTTLTGAGGWDIFVAKYTPDGTLLWVEGAGGVGFEFGTNIAVDAAGNIVVSALSFGAVAIGDTTLTNAGAADMVIAKFTGAGDFLWAEQAGGTAFDEPVGLIVDSQANIVVGGYFGDAAVFGDTTLTASGLQDMVIVKYDADGHLQWAEQAGGNDVVSANALALTGSGHIVVTGDFSGTATFGDSTQISAGQQQMYAAKYSGDGDFSWVIPASGTAFSSGLSVAVDGPGDLLVSGLYGDGSARFGNTTLPGRGNQDIFIAKIGENLTAIAGSAPLPRSLTLSQNYPNPFNPATTIEFVLPQSGRATLSVFNVSGERVATLVSDELAAGRYTYRWDASGMASGTYFYRLETAGHSEVRKALLLK